MSKLSFKRRKTALLLFKVVFGSITATTVFLMLFIFLSVKFGAKNVTISTAAEIQPEEVVEEIDHTFTICIDPGHGGKDPGAVHNKTQEKDINLFVSMGLKADLESLGYNVILSRSTDKFVELSRRTDLAKANDADLIVSIHCNYNEYSTAANGLECYYYMSDESKAYADDIVKTLGNRTTIKTNGVYENDLHMCRESDCPSVLVELGYLSNYNDRVNLKDDDYVVNLCSELSIAIDRAIMSQTGDK